jgi:hypothetical protein
LRGVINIKFLQNKLEFKLDIQIAKQKNRERKKQKKEDISRGALPTEPAQEQPILLTVSASHPQAGPIRQERRFSSSSSLLTHDGQSNGELHRDAAHKLGPGPQRSATNWF